MSRFDEIYQFSEMCGGHFGFSPVIVALLLEILGPPFRTP